MYVGSKFEDQKKEWLKNFNGEGKMREYAYKKFYRNYKYKKLLKDPVEYSVHVAGINRDYVTNFLKVYPKTIKKAIKVCKKEFKKFGRSDAAGANQGYLLDLFVCVHWE